MVLVTRFLSGRLWGWFSGFFSWKSYGKYYKIYQSWSVLKVTNLYVDMYVIMQALIYFHHTAENIDITLYMEIYVHTCQEDVCTYVLSMYNKIKKIKLRRFFPKKPPLSPISFWGKMWRQSYLGFANSRTIKKDKSFSPFRISIEICSFTMYFRTQKKLATS